MNAQAANLVTYVLRDITQQQNALWVTTALQLEMASFTLNECTNVKLVRGTRKQSNFTSTTVTTALLATTVTKLLSQT